MPFRNGLLLLALFTVAFVTLAGVAGLPASGGMPPWPRVAVESGICAVAAFALGLLTPRRR